MVINNKIILQYGKTINTTTSTIKFPISFTTTNFSIQMFCFNGTTQWEKSEIILSSITKASFNYTRFDIGTHYWFCIGY